MTDQHASPAAGTETDAPPPQDPAPSFAVAPDDDWSEEESVLSWKLFVGLFVGLAVIGVLAYVLFGGGDDEAGPVAAGGSARSDAAVVDEFDRADSTDGLGEADTGQPWKVVSGTWGIAGEQAYVAVPNEQGGKRSIAVVDLGMGNGAVEATMPSPANGWGIIFRYRDSENYWMVTYAPQYATFNLQKVVAGKVSSPIPGGVGLVDVADGAKVGVVFNGPEIAVTVDGVVKATATDPAVQGGTQVGMVVIAGGADAARWEGFAALLGSAPGPGGGG